MIVANGDHERMVPTSDSYDLARCLPDSELVIYPDAGHGGIFQLHREFVQQALEFPERSASAARADQDGLLADGVPRGASHLDPHSLAAAVMGDRGCTALSMRGAPLEQS